jgi:hypothetical protein
VEKHVTFLPGIQERKMDFYAFAQSFANGITPGFVCAIIKQ